jgi:hypothetical protein
VFRHRSLKFAQPIVRRHDVVFRPNPAGDSAQL